MTVESIQAKLEKEKEKYIDKVMKCLLSDPFADDFNKTYKNTREYLYETLEKEGSILGGLISAMEHYLDK